MAVLTNEQLQQILNTIQTSTSSQHLGEDQKTQGRGSDGTKCGTSVNQGGGGGEMNKEDRRKGDGGGGVTDSPETSPDKDNSWLDERQSYSRSAIDAKKAQWKRELERGAEETRLEELDRQREETTERKRREKLLQSQVEDHGLWATHFDSLQRRPPVHPAAPSAPSAPPPAPSSGSERGDWEPSSSLSLVWEATQLWSRECGAGQRGYDQWIPDYLRTMTALLDPTQIEERERRRLKQLEQQVVGGRRGGRAIEAQMEERRQQKEREKARRREEEEEEDRRVALEREKLQRQYKLDTLRERPKEQPSGQAEEPQRQQEVQQEVQGGSAAQFTGQAEHVEEEVSSSVSPYRDTAVQTEAPPTLPLKEDDVSLRSTSHLPLRLLLLRTAGAERTVRAGKENVCVPGGGAGGERTHMKRLPGQTGAGGTRGDRASRRFVPASERYPAALQRNRQESRLRRQAELLALQRTCQSRTDALLL
ncbi:hypothetical protein INR49_001687 [Caranx melampygus]|nr:hypothetical protein INR49_001687 [Caranx melampygus]